MRLTRRRDRYKPHLAVYAEWGYRVLIIYKWLYIMLNGTVCVISRGDDQKTDNAMENLVLAAGPVF